jgi:hypothetical protein
VTDQPILMGSLRPVESRIQVHACPRSTRGSANWQERRCREFQPAIPFGGLDTWENPAGAVVKSMTAEKLAKRAGYTPRPKP